MKKYLFLGVITLLIMHLQSSAQVSGVKTIPGDYPTLAAAITDLNAVGVGAGGATIVFGGSETAPAASGFSLGSAALNATLSAANPLTITGGGTLLAAAGGVATPGTTATPLDGILRLIGCDFVTISGLTLTDPNAANPATVEFGIGLFKLSATDGCQNTTITNNTITLNRANFAAGAAESADGSVGIWAGNTLSTGNATLAITAVTGSHSNNKFYTNTIQNANGGIYLRGFLDATPYALYDQNNDIGGASAAQGNTIINYGGGAAAIIGAQGVRAIYQNLLNVSYNTINNNTGAGVNHVSIVRGMLISTAVSATSTITNNIITLTSAATASAVDGINSSTGSTPITINTVTISRNTISLRNTVVTSTGTVVGILSGGGANTVNLTLNSVTINNSGVALTTGIQHQNLPPNFLNINDNTINLSRTAGTTSGVNWIVQNQPITAVGSLLNINKNTFLSTLGITGTSFTSYLINNSNATQNTNVLGNVTSGNIVRNGTGAATFIGYYNFGTPTGGTETVRNNNFSNINLVGTPAAASIFYGMRAASDPPQTRLIGTNTISNIQNGTGRTIGLLVDYYNATSYCDTNTITNITGQGDVYGISNSNTTTTGGNSAGGSIRANNITTLTSSGASNTVVGISNAPTAAASGIIIAKNIISDLSVSGITAPIVRGILQVAVGTNTLISENIITNLRCTSAPATSLGIYGIQVQGSTTPTISKNNVNTLTAGPSANAQTAVMGFYLSGGSGVFNLFNNFFTGLEAPNAIGNTTFGTPILGICLGTTVATLKAYYNTVYIGVNAPSVGGANFGATGVYFPLSATTLMDLKNNIIYVNATPNGTGVVAAVRRHTAGAAANTAPVAGNFDANNNIYYTPCGPNNYLYVDGISTTTPLLNGYALAGLTESAANNIVNDPNFNLLCGKYKQFINGGTVSAAVTNRESDTYTEKNLTRTVVSPPVFAPSGDSYAENDDLTTTPAIADDYNSAPRSSDRGAVTIVADAIPDPGCYLVATEPCSNGVYANSFDKPSQLVSGNEFVIHSYNCGDEWTNTNTTYDPHTTANNLVIDEDNDDWVIFRKAMSLVVGKKYRVKIYYKGAPAFKLHLANVAALPANMLTKANFLGTAPAAAPLEINTQTIAGVPGTYRSYTYIVSPLTTGDFFFAIEGTTTGANILNIDDIQVDVMPDLEVTALVSPIDACTSARTFEVKVKNNGCRAADFTASNLATTSSVQGTPIRVWGKVTHTAPAACAGFGTIGVQYFYKDIVTTTLATAADITVDLTTASPTSGPVVTAFPMMFPSADYAPTGKNAFQDALSTATQDLKNNINFLVRPTAAACPLDKLNLNLPGDYVFDAGFQYLYASDEDELSSNDGIDGTIATRTFTAPLPDLQLDAASFIVSPAVTPDCPGNKTVTLRFKNNGTCPVSIGTLSDFNIPVVLSAKVTHTPAAGCTAAPDQLITRTINPACAASVALAPGATSADYVVSTMVDMSQPGTYKVEEATVSVVSAAVAATCDAIPANNIFIGTRNIQIPTPNIEVISNTLSTSGTACGTASTDVNVNVVNNGLCPLDLSKYTVTATISVAAVGGCAAPSPITASTVLTGILNTGFQTNQTVASLTGLAPGVYTYTAATATEAECYTDAVADNVSSTTRTLTVRPVPTVSSVTGNCTSFAVNASICDATSLEYSLDGVAFQSSATFSTAGTAGSGTVTVRSVTSPNCLVTASYNVCATVLSVDLVSFSAKANLGYNSLNWVTNSERNNDYFVVERSTDNLNFENIARVKGNGTTNTKQNYNFDDVNARIGTSFYRLKQVDFDGTVTYSNVVSVVQVPKKLTILEARPNPTKGELNVVVFEPTQGAISLSVLDITGKIVYSQQYTATAGSNSLQIDVANIAAGLYFLKVMDKSSNAVIKLIKE